MLKADNCGANCSIIGRGDESTGEKWTTNEFSLRLPGDARTLPTTNINFAICHDFCVYVSAHMPHAHSILEHAGNWQWPTRRGCAENKIIYVSACVLKWFWPQSKFNAGASPEWANHQQLFLSRCKVSRHEDVMFFLYCVSNFLIRISL